MYIYVFPTSTDFYLVLHIILKVFASYTWFMAL